MKQKRKIVDVDNNDSDEEQLQQRKLRIKQLNLSEQQLNERLETLKNYDTWRRTKAKRIRIQDLAENNQSHLLQMALSYGSKNGYNEVLADFLGNEGLTQHCQPEGDQINPFQRLLNERFYQREEEQSTKISYLTYKNRSNQKQKIYRIIHNANQRQLEKTRKSKTQTVFNSKETTCYNTFFSRDDVPKEIKMLSKQLKILPVVCRKNTSKSSQNNRSIHNPEDDDLIDSLYQTQAQTFGAINRIKVQTNNFRIGVKSRNWSQQSKKTRFLKTKTSYTRQIEAIMDKSKELLHQEIQNKESQEKGRDQTNSDVGFEVIKKNKDKALEYWPSYSKYAIPDTQVKKIDKIKGNISQLQQNLNDFPTQINDVLKIIETSFVKQQQLLQKQIVFNQKNALDLRYKYQMDMQRENYKRNIKSLLKCKKQYRIEKKRQEVRANGIKRYKRSKPEDKSKRKVVEQVYDPEL